MQEISQATSVEEEGDCKVDISRYANVSSAEALVAQER